MEIGLERPLAAETSSETAHNAETAATEALGLRQLNTNTK